MFSYVSLLRDRFSLRLNEDHLSFHYYNEMVRKWDAIDGNTLASHSAVIRGLYDGRKVIGSSRRQVEQNFIIVHLEKKQTVGSIRITDTGAMIVSTAPNFRFNGTLPEYWQHRTTVLLGVMGACTINIRDLMADDEDILRLKQNVDRWFIPTRYVDATAAYDAQTSEKELVNTITGIGLKKGAACLAVRDDDSVYELRQTELEGKKTIQQEHKPTDLPKVENNDQANPASTSAAGQVQTGLAKNEPNDDKVKPAALAADSDVKQTGDNKAAISHSVTEDPEDFDKPGTAIPKQEGEPKFFELA